MAVIRQGNRLRTLAAAIAGVGAVGGLVLSLNASAWGADVSAGGTLTGVAPMAVLFDATGTTEATGLDTFNAVGYHHDFGYAHEADAGYWTYPAGASNLAKSRYVGGPVAAHVYETPGTYTYSVNAQTPAGATAPAYITIVVQDPDVVYAGATTIYTTGTPGAGETLWTFSDASPKTLTAADSGKRFRFKAGETFAGHVRVPITSGSPITNVLIDKQGTGADPIFSGANAVRLGNNVSSISSLGSTPGFPTRIIVTQLAGRVTDDGMSRWTLFHKCDMTGKAIISSGSTGDDNFSSQALASGLAGQVWTNSRDNFLVGCTIDDPAKTQTMFLYGHRIAWLGNVLGRSKEHGTRVKACYKGIYAHNYVLGYDDYPTVSGKNLITVRTQEISTVEANATTPATINKDGIWRTTRVMKGTENERGRISTRFFVVDSNVFGATDHSGLCEWGMAADMPNDFAVYWKADIIFQRNRRYQSVTPATQPALQPWNGQRVTFRHNEDYTPSSGTPVSPSGTARLGISTAQGNAAMIADPTTYYGPYYINTSTDTVTNGLVTGRIIEAPAMLLPAKAA